MYKILVMSLTFLYHLLIGSYDSTWSRQDVSSVN